uniref:BPTI/Kunitz inhibitor domain-containing protein n=1 Tax=Neolamprologus brichardi TaxID=32507 RepID=A0A3Q4GKM8_NEOBR
MLTLFCSVLCQDNPTPCLVPLDPCAAAPVVGPCKGTFPRWYYDQNVGECKHFLYGGCQGNHNNFLQESDCVSECIQKSESPPYIHFD